MPTKIKYLGILIPLLAGVCSCGSSEAGTAQVPCRLSADCLNGDVCVEGTCTAGGKPSGESRIRKSEVLFRKQGAVSADGLVVPVAVRVNYLSDGPTVTLVVAPWGRPDSPVSHVVVVKRGSVQTMPLDGYVIEAQTTSHGTLASVWLPGIGKDLGSVVLRNISTNAEPEISIPVSELDCASSNNHSIVGQSGVLNDELSAALIALHFFHPVSGQWFCTGLFNRKDGKWNRETSAVGADLDGSQLIQSVPGSQTRYSIASRTTKDGQNLEVVDLPPSQWDLTKRLSFVFPCISTGSGQACAAVGKDAEPPHWQVIEPKSGAVTDYGPVVPLTKPSLLGDIYGAFPSLIPIPTHRGLLLPVMVTRGDGTCAQDYTYSFRTPGTAEPLFRHTACPADDPVYQILRGSTIVSFTGKEVTMVGLWLEENGDVKLRMIEDAVP